MEISDTRALLARLAAIDGRELSEAVAQAWHSVIGHLAADVANAALTLALREPQLGKLEPKHVMTKVPSAIQDLNKKLKALDDSEEGWVGSPPPKNFDDMLEFYKQLWAAKPWQRYYPNGMPVSASDLDRNARAAAAQLGWKVVEPVWDDNEPF